MNTIQDALEEIQRLFPSVVGAPVPELDPASYLDLPSGVDPVQHVVREVDQLRNLAHRLSLAPRFSQWIPVADTVATEDAVVIHVEVPGMARDQLKVVVTDGECIIRGEKQPVGIREGQRTLVRESVSGPFERRFALPTGVREDAVTARCKDGVLELRLPLTVREGVPQKEVEVQ